MQGSNDEYDLLQLFNGKETKEMKKSESKMCFALPCIQIYVQHEMFFVRARTQ
jgi:hypothetical protein